MSSPSTIIRYEEFASHPLLSRLLQLHTIPKEIHIRGTLPEVTIDMYGRATPRILTIVGSRRNTPYGRRALESLIASLAQEDVIIISGLALGIDGLAHRTALTHNLITIAVPGSGLDPKVLYPHAHLTLADDITSHGGALLSELGDDTIAAPWTFPLRNRIMAALCDALLIVEAEEKSGTLITARLALELGRDIGAIPGEIFSSHALGTNTLIKEGAYPIASASDLFALLHLSEPPVDTQSIKRDIKNSPLFNNDEKILMEIIRGSIDKDTLYLQSKFDFSKFLAVFSTLEINGYIEETFGEVRRLV